MAHREMRKSRVLMVAAGLFVVLLGLWVRVGWLQIALHDQFLARAAENQQLRLKLIPERGELLDRHGAVLARDLRVSRIAVYRPQLKSPLRAAQQLGPILGEPVAKLRRRLDEARGYRWITEDLPPEVGERVRALRIEGLDVEDETRREYRLGPAASEILGRTNRDNAGVDGIEYQFDSRLAGQSGWVTAIRAGTRRLLRLPGAEHRAARDGSSLVLTLDADLQAIVERHLARAVDTLGARRGFALFLDPWTGEILAAACVPHLEAGKAKNWTFTDQYEPGSTYKIVVAGAALEENVARTNEYFTASTTGSAEIFPGFRLRDSHPSAGYTFFGAIQHSSNIVCAKLGLRLGADRLYRYSNALGFGSLTGVEFPGEASGKLRPVSSWQPRSAPTIAMGQEIAVTPLQLALAYGAIANGGVLMEPMLVREERSSTGRLVRRWSPQPRHRVFSEATTATLRRMLCAVVDSGTATSARLDGFEIAGKTGTAQKYDAATGGYGRGMYIASFAGIAPADRPRIVGVVVLDEPPRNLYYGGQVAAPVFREIVLDLMRRREGLLGPVDGPVAARPPAVPGVIAPDLRMLPAREAERLLSGFGLRARFEGQGLRVLSQSPAAGQPVDRGGSVTAWLSPPGDSSHAMLPDLTGLPMREALRQLTARQVRPRLFGHGLVVRQDPAPGTPLPLAQVCRLWCEVPEAPGKPGAIASVAAAPAHRP
ncbi:MAG: transpeptidase family protein [Candidatus Eisenbacteria bacterium]|nr:transpeptidase family protein [Candidatus Eisenbacteria bacterium]